MFSNNKVRMYVAAFLLWCVLSSKHILIYNEETLVALSFFLFVYLTYKYAGDSIGASMDSRGQEIAAELEQFLVAREEALLNLSEAHKATSNLNTHVSSLAAGVTQAMTNLKHECSSMVHRDIVRSIDNRCAYLSTISANTNARMLDKLAAGLPALVMLEHGQDASGVSSNTLKQALAALEA
jgi:F0F1-type ATP synthase membrane subunit b/b'